MIMDKYILKTYRGVELDLSTLPTLDLSGINYKDVSWALSNINRYIGNTRLQVNVAAHSIYMARHFLEQGKNISAKSALMHDCTEMIMGDLLSFWKNKWPQIREYEHTVLWPLFQRRFNIPNLTSEVEFMDKVEMPKYERDPVVVHNIILQASQAFLEFNELFELLYCV